MAKFGQYESLLKQLLKNKSSLTEQKVDGRNKYQVKINNLKKQMKAQGLKFNQLLKDVKGQEKEGLWSRKPKVKHVEAKIQGPHLTTFKEAFREARNKGPLQFTWNKKKYTTEFKEEEEKREKESKELQKIADRFWMKQKAKSTKKDTTIKITTIPSPVKKQKVIKKTGGIVRIPKYVL